VATLAAYPAMMQRARKREGLRACRAAWLIGVSVREYREIEAGDRFPEPGKYERICEL
jgi:Helix-turn-helix domain